MWRIRSPVTGQPYELTDEDLATHCFFCARTGVDGYCTSHDSWRERERRFGNVIVPGLPVDLGSFEAENEDLKRLFPMTAWEKAHAK